MIKIEFIWNSNQILKFAFIWCSTLYFSLGVLHASGSIYYLHYENQQNNLLFWTSLKHNNFISFHLYIYNAYVIKWKALFVTSYLCVRRNRKLKIIVSCFRSFTLNWISSVLWYKPYFKQHMSRVNYLTIYFLQV